MPAASRHADRLGFIHAGVRAGASASAAGGTCCVPLDTEQNALESVGGKGETAQPPTFRPPLCADRAWLPLPLLASAPLAAPLTTDT